VNFKEPSELDKLLELVGEAAQVARDSQKIVGGTATLYKADDSPVTLADQAIERFLVEGLSEHFPGCGFLGEESGGWSAKDGLDSDLWVIDPIDGTANYAAGLATYAIAVGRLRGARADLGAVALPALGELYAVGADGLLRRNGELFEVQASPEGDVLGLVRESRAFLCLPSALLKTYRCDFAGNIRAFGSTVYHCLLVVTGAAIGAVVTPFVWDIAGVLPILQATGRGLFSYQTGEPLDIARWAANDFQPFVMIACAPAHLDALRQTLQLGAAR